MQLFVQYFLGIRMFWKGLAFVFKHQLAWFFIFPLMFNVLLWWIGFESSTQVVGWMTHTVQSYFTFVDQWPQWIQVAFGIFRWLLVALLWLVLFLIVVYVGGFVVLMALSPFLSWMAAKTMCIQTGVDEPFQWLSFLSDIWRGIRISLRNLFFELFLNVLFLMAMFIPIAGLLSPLAIFVNSSYFYGFSFLDYGLEQHKIGFKQAIVFVQFNRGLALGIGTLFSFCMAIPYIGVFLSGFVAVVSVVGATLAVNEVLTKGGGGTTVLPFGILKAIRPNNG
jgi:CysZ protein